MRRKWNDKRQLIALGITLQVNDEGEYVVHYKDRLVNKTKHTTYHKYGRSITYDKYVFYLGDGKYAHILAQVLVWLWYNERVPVGYDIDHIDNDKFNNHISNLQLLTRKENLRKRGLGRNQYNYHMTDEEILALRESKELAKQARKLAREQKQQEYLAKIEEEK